MNEQSGSLLLVAVGSGLPSPLADVALIVGIAALLAIVFQRLGLPIVLGYLLAGLLVGPHLPTGFTVSPGGKLPSAAHVYGGLPPLAARLAA